MMANLFTREMILRSLISTGNTERIHNVFQKAQRGETVSLVYLGGSITEGALAEPRETNCYAFLSAHDFCKKYMASEHCLRFHNAGISGTPSLLGITRCDQDVLQYHPDVVFIEFAVNDSDEEKNKIAYESLIRKLLCSKTKPAVVLIFTRMEKGYTAQPHMHKIGMHYQLGMISVGNAITPEIQSGHMNWSDYSSDYAHPTTEGHRFISDMIMHYFDEALCTDSTVYHMPHTTVFGNQLETLCNIRCYDPRIRDAGSFVYDEAPCYSYKSGWIHGMNSDNKPMKIQVQGTHMTIAFKQEKNEQYGRAEVFVNDKSIAVLPGFSENAWGNVVTELIYFDQPSPQEICIRMHEADRNKTFCLLDIAVAGS